MVAMVDADGNLIPQQSGRRSLQPGPVVIRKGLDTDNKTNAGRLTSKLGLSARHLLLRPLALLIDCYEERLEWKTHGIRGTVNISRTRLLNQSRRRIACLRNSRGESP
jgi:hypothetical protein